MDMKKILQAMDGASTKPVEGSNDIKKFLSVVTEGANPHKVALPVQMAMQHYAEPVVAQPKPIKEVKKAAMSSMLYQYYTEAEQQIVKEEKAKKELISEQAKRIASRILAKENYQNPAEYDQEGEMAQGSLHTLKRAVDGLMNTIDNKDNLPEWCQEKISLAEDYLVTVWDYLQSEQEQGVDESRYGNRDAYQRDYDSSRTGFGRAPREDDEYVNGPDPETFKINCTMTDLETGQPRKRTATVTTTHGYGHAVNMALNMYHKQGYTDAEEVKGVAESKKKSLKNSNPCWKGYHPVGTKEKNGRTVPNCVPKE